MSQADIVNTDTEPLKKAVGAKQHQVVGCDAQSLRSSLPARRAHVLTMKQPAAVRLMNHWLNATDPRPQLQPRGQRVLLDGPGER